MDDKDRDPDLKAILTILRVLAVVGGSALLIFSLMKAAGG